MYYIIYIIVFQILCPHRLLQNIEYNSLCHIVFGYLFHNQLVKNPPAVLKTWI